jgi:hypothetical protein
MQIFNSYQNQNFRQNDANLVIVVEPQVICEGERDGEGIVSPSPILCGVLNQELWPPPPWFAKPKQIRPTPAAPSSTIGCYLSIKASASETHRMQNMGSVWMPPNMQGIIASSSSWSNQGPIWPPVPTSSNGMWILFDKVGTGSHSDSETRPWCRRLWSGTNCRQTRHINHVCHLATKGHHHD